MSITRKQFLQNTGWAAAGATLGFIGGGQFGASPVATRPAPPPPAPAPRGEESFSQCGEDMSVNFAFKQLGIEAITYLDVGANHPAEGNNTYFFYRRGHRGVLVEPNESLCKQLRAVRPEDTTLAVGIGVAAAKEADYYVMNYDALNTFSKEDAERQAGATQGRVTIQKVIKVPLLNINDVMAEHFKGAPTFLSVDTEGFDLAILKSIDYARFRPKIICAETLVSHTTKAIPEIPRFMESQGYVPRGGSIVNTIFIDSKLL